MPRQGRPLIALLAVTLLVAGCSGSDETPEEAQPSPTAAPASVGSIEGVVLSDEDLPIAGVEVSILEASATDTTGQDGGFRFDEVPEGTYTIAAGKLGFESAARSLQVSAGETASVELRLSPVAVAIEPYHLTYPYSGTMTCGVLLVPWCGIFQDLEGETGVNPTQDRYTFNWTWPSVNEYPLSQVIEVVWTPATGATGQNLNPLYFTSAGDGVNSHTVWISPTEGLPSPIRIEIEGADLVAGHEAYPESDFILGIYPPAAEATVAQDFEVYRTDFYGAQHPEGWTALDTE